MRFEVKKSLRLCKDVLREIDVAAKQPPPERSGATGDRSERKHSFLISPELRNRFGQHRKREVGRNFAAEQSVNDSR